MIGGSRDVRRACGGFLGPVWTSVVVFSGYLQKRRCVRAFPRFTNEEE